MHFCIKCNNMYYIKIDNSDSNKLVHYCRNCGDVNKEIVDNFCVSSINIKKQSKIRRPAASGLLAQTVSLHSAA